MRFKVLAIAFSVLGAVSALSCSNIIEAQNGHSGDPRFPGWRTNTLERSIDLTEIVSGGPSKDGIPAIDQPNLISIADARSWLRDREPVIALELDGQARAYPLQILIWHEIVNDEINATPVAVTFCPLCYSALAFDRRLDGRTLRFGVSGMLRHSDMIMYDRETESWWQQFTGEAIVGELRGKKLHQVSCATVFDFYS
jgi:hypothetical protein